MSKLVFLGLLFAVAAQAGGIPDTWTGKAYFDETCFPKCTPTITPTVTITVTPTPNTTETPVK